jgi:adenylate cyclase
MPQIRERTVVFADLRGSTSLYETIGNAAAVRVVTERVGALADAVVRSGGQVVKTLGDGLMAVFDSPAAALAAADAMHTVPPSFALPGPAAGSRQPLKRQVAIAHGEVVEFAGDCFGDAVNVAARLLDHAGDGETLVTADALAGLDARERARFRSLDRVRLRGRNEPVHIHRLEARRLVGDTAATAFGELAPLDMPHGIRLTWLELDRYYDNGQLPVVLGRSADADYCVEDSRVSRLHARIDRHGGSLQLTDLSYNGTFVRFANDTEMLSLRRGTCTLHGSGIIALGTASLDALSPCVHFEVRH